MNRQLLLQLFPIPTIIRHEVKFCKTREILFDLSFYFRDLTGFSNPFQAPLELTTQF